MFGACTRRGLVTGALLCPVIKAGKVGIYRYFDVFEKLPAVYGPT